MKKIMIIACLTLLCMKEGFACDVCGCQLGGLSFGLMAGVKTHYFGLRYSQAAFSANIKLNSKLLPDEYSNDTYTTTEFLSRIILSNKFQVQVVVPYVNNTMNGNMQNLNFSGIGDPSVLVYYHLLDGKQNNKKETKANHILLVGGGVKLPFGKFNRFDKGEVVNRNFQVGSGSVDYILSANYTIGFKNWGFNFESSYKMNTKNPDGYQFGNQLHANAIAFMSIPLKEALITPFTGMMYEIGGTHYDNRIKQLNTGGNAILGTLGLQANWKRLSLNASYQTPVSQNYNSDNISTITASKRFNVGVIFKIAKKGKIKPFKLDIFDKE